MPITIIDDNLLNGPEAVTLAAAATGYTTVPLTINVHDNETAVLTLNMPTTALEGAGLLHGAGTLTSSAAPSQNIVVQLTSNNTTEVSVPTTVMLPAGQTSVSFDVTIGDDYKLDGTQTVTVTAHVENWTDSSATINVFNNNIMGLSGEWHTFGNGPAHTGYFPGIMGNVPLTSLLWSVAISGSQVAIGGGRVYLTPDSGSLVALDETTGAQLWKDSFTSVFSLNPPTFDSGQVYVQSDTGNESSQLWSFNAATAPRPG